MTRGKEARAEKTQAEQAAPDDEAIDTPPESLELSASGTRPPPDTSVGPGLFGDFPPHVRCKFGDESDFLDIYRLVLPKPLINDIRGAMVGGAMATSFGQGGVVTRMLLEKSTGIVYCCLRATAKPESDYRRCVAFIGDALVDLDPQGNVYR